MMNKLAYEMKVRLHPKKSLDISPGFIGAQAHSFTFFSGRIISKSGRITIGCSILCGLDDLSLKGVFAHELAHIKKNHILKMLLPLLLFIPVIIMWIFSQSQLIIPTLLTISILIFICSLISWNHEYEADAIAAVYVGKKNMAYTLKQVGTILNRPGDTLIHPSFKKRILRLS